MDLLLKGLADVQRGLAEVQKGILELQKAQAELLKGQQELAQDQARIREELRSVLCKRRNNETLTGETAETAETTAGGFAFATPAKRQKKAEEDAVMPNTSGASITVPAGGGAPGPTVNHWHSLTAGRGAATTGGFIDEPKWPKKAATVEETGAFTSNMTERSSGAPGFTVKNGLLLSPKQRILDKVGRPERVCPTITEEDVVDENSPSYRYFHGSPEPKKDAVVGNKMTTGEHPLVTTTAAGAESGGASTTSTNDAPQSPMGGPTREIVFGSLAFQNAYQLSPRSRYEKLLQVLPSPEFKKPEKSDSENPKPEENCPRQKKGPRVFCGPNYKSSSM